MAQNLSREYTAAGGWETVGTPLSEAGYVYEGVAERERSEENGTETVEFIHEDSIRVVVTDIYGRVVKDNITELSSGTEAPDLEGHREDSVRFDHEPARRSRLR